MLNKKYKKINFLKIYLFFLNILSAKIKHEPVRAQLNERVLNKSVVKKSFSKVCENFPLFKNLMLIFRKHNHYTLQFRLN